MKKPYIKKICEIHHILVWFVDGNYIRTNIDEEFTNFGLYHKDYFSYIPKNEFWIDHGAKEGEEHFFIDNLLALHKFLGEGMNYEKARVKADETEKCERAKSKLAKKVKKSKDLIKEVHKKLLKGYSTYVSVWIVNGELVRDLYFIDFTEGGHDKVYSFIPNHEVWLDDQINRKERELVLLHELAERALMSKGWEYDKAHREASKTEFYCRHHKEELDKKLREAIEKQKTKGL